VTYANRCSATAMSSIARRRTCRCSAPLPPSSTTTASPPSITPCWTPSQRQDRRGLPIRPAEARHQAVHLQDHHHPAGAHPLPGGNRRNGANLPPATPKARPTPAAGLASGRNGQNPFGGGPGRRPRRPAANRLKAEIDNVRESWTPGTEKLVREWEETRERLFR
jgi:hypothetical protein